VVVVICTLQWRVTGRDSAWWGGRGDVSRRTYGLRELPLEVAARASCVGCFHVVGVQPQDLGEIGHGLFELAELLVHCPAVVEGIQVAGVAAQHVAVV
jgi:hypothetical protein